MNRQILIKAIQNNNVTMLIQFIKLNQQILKANSKNDQATKPKPNKIREKKQP